MLKGQIVVEAAGNGFQNLDDPIYDTRPTGFPTSWRNPFNPGNPSSGAVVVGAGAPPPNTHGADWGPDRSRLDFSNYGRRVDVQGWGREVTTTGYGDLQGGLNEDLWYTDHFSGTSSASPVVVGALAGTQGVLRARGHIRMTSEQARALLRATGSPQQDAPTRPASERIGNRPNLRELIPAAARFRSRSADYDGDGLAEVFITSPWGIGILEQAGATMAAPTMQPNGTRFGGWLLNTADNHFGPPADYDGDGKAELLVTSPWGIGILEQAGATMAAPTMQPNGTRFGGWLLNTGDNYFGPAADYDGDGKAELLVASPWGIGILEQAGATMAAPMMAPNGTRFGGWLLNTGDNSFGPAADFDGDGQAELLVTSPWGIGVLEQSGSTMAAPMMAPNGTRFGGWLLNTGDNTFGPVGDFDGDGKDGDPRHEPVGHRSPEAGRQHVHGADDGAERHPLRRLAAEHRRQLLRPGGRLRRRRQGRDPGHEPLGRRHAQADREHLHGPDDAAERNALRRLAAEHGGQPARDGCRLRR